MYVCVHLCTDVRTYVCTQTPRHTYLRTYIRMYAARDPSLLWPQLHIVFCSNTRPFPPSTNLNKTERLSEYGLDSGHLGVVEGDAARRGEPLWHGVLEDLLLHLVAQKFMVQVGADAGLVDCKHLESVLHSVKRGGLPHIVHSEVGGIRGDILAPRAELQSHLLGGHHILRQSRTVAVGGAGWG